MPCKCYHAERNFLGKIGVCWGTKECEACSCCGDESRCDFYDYVRKRANNRAMYKQLCGQLRRMSSTWGVCQLSEAADIIEQLNAQVEECKEIADIWRKAYSGLVGSIYPNAPKK